MKPRSLSIRALLCAASATAGIVFANAAMAQPFEVPPSIEAGALLGAKATGPNYRVVSPVSSDGFLRLYTLETTYGEFHAEGDVFLRMRLRELAAIEALSRVENTKTFQDGFQKAFQGPIDFVGDAVTKPGETMERTISGVGRLFGRVASGVRNVGKGPDNMAEALLGVSSAKREIAAGLGVDPYTDFKPLADRLDRAAQASAIGGLTVKGLLSLIPGGVGIAASSISSASDVTDLVKERTPSELLDINRGKLNRAVGRKPSIDLFLDNKAYTPTDQTIIAEALFKLREVRNVDAFLVPAAGISDRFQAVFMRERAVLLARHHQEVEPLSSFVTVAGLPFCISKDGRTIGLFPIDNFVWTEQAERLVAQASDKLKETGQTGGVALFITGKATATAKAELQNIGWTITEQINPPLP